MSQYETEEFSGYFLHETEKAILFLPVDWDEDDAVWLPKSQIDYEDKDYEKGDDIIVDIPTWLIEEKGI